MRVKKVIAAHLLNDFSGSPLVLSNCIKVLNDSGYEVDLYASGSNGFLSRAECNRCNFYYKRSHNKLFTLVSLLVSQIYLFLSILLKVAFLARCQKPVLIVNTLLPFGAALAGKMGGCEVIYYVHETSISPLALKRVLKFILRITASKVVYVSSFLKFMEGVGNKKIVETVIYNSLPFDAVISANNIKADGDFIVFMPCSLKKYKGIYEFVQIAKVLQSAPIKFVLALNSEEKEFLSFSKEIGVMDNLSLIRRPENIDEIYKSASLVVNLSKPDAWIETFGMTVIEAFSYGCPVIVPTVGGVTELVEDDFNGYKISVDNIPLISKTIYEIFNNKIMYEKLSNNALHSANCYCFSKFKFKVLALLEGEP